MSEQFISGQQPQVTIKEIEAKVATEDTLQKLVGFEIPAHDEIVLTYISVGNDGEGEIETVVYKLASTTIATLTLSYNAEDKLNSVVKT